MNTIKGRVINTHKVEGATGELSVSALGQRTRGGANTNYCVMEAVAANAEEGHVTFCDVIAFQHGPVPEVGNNGLTMESLLAIIDDRLSGFQDGDFPCTANENARYHVREALKSLKTRTADRIDRDVEGKYEG